VSSDVNDACPHIQPVRNGHGDYRNVTGSAARRTCVVTYSMRCIHLSRAERRGPQPPSPIPYVIVNAAAFTAFCALSFDMCVYL
jgi:hypothetical protein